MSSIALHSPQVPRPSSRTATASPTSVYNPQRSVTPTTQHGLRKADPVTAQKRKSTDISGSEAVLDRSPEAVSRGAYGRRLSNTFVGNSPPRPNTGRRTPSKMTTGRVSPAVTLSTLSHAVEAARPTPSTASAAPMKMELPSATYTPGDGDYFGADWADASPARPKRDDRPPGSSSYLGSSQVTRINPGANNSFAPPHPNRSVEGSPRPGGAADGDGPDRKNRPKKTPSQKAMLARALEKANHAVVLDNAANFEGAVAAYNDACNLLHQVMVRTNGDEDRNKLDSIKTTYTQRISDLKKNELANTQSTAIDKALPEVPQQAQQAHGEEQPLSRISNQTNAESSRPVEWHQAEQGLTVPYPAAMSRANLPPRRQSLSPNPISLSDQFARPLPNTQESQQAPSPRKTSAPVPDAPKPSVSSRNLSVPVDSKLAPAPLSPRRLGSPMTLPLPQIPQPVRIPSPGNTSAPRPAPDPAQIGHSRQDTAGSTSWLDTIGESGGSDTSSMNSDDSADFAPQQSLKRGITNTEAEFQSALDAAIEAAYDQGYEPADEETYEEPVTTAAYAGYSSDTRKNLEIARQRAKEAEREAAIEKAKERERRRKLEEISGKPRAVRGQSIDLDYNDAEAEAEERLLDEMTSEWVMEAAPSQPRGRTVPRKSDSSSFSQRTYGSSVGSMPTSVGTPLSTVNEAVLPSSKMPALPNIATSLPNGNTEIPHQAPKPPPPIPKAQPPEPPVTSLQSPGVRERRLSGQKFAALKIDTTAKPADTIKGPLTQPAMMHGGLTVEGPRSAGLPKDRLDAPNSAYNQTFLLHSAGQSTFSGISPADLPSGAEAPSMTKELPPEPKIAPPSPKKPPRATLKKNFSSSSLKSAKSSDDAPGTPIGRVFSRKETMPAMPDLPAPASHSFARVNTTGSISFLDHEIHSPMVPGSPNPNALNAPMPLEPCPEIPTLRPFWLMRAIYQTIAHPRGGYLSTRLFVPRDIWRVKNVKLKNVDEKVAQLDLLTALLQNLSKVDTMDADAVLEQMQSFELQTDKIQSQLAKKLSAEVGPQGIAALLKASPQVDDGSAAEPPSGREKAGKQYLSSWRKLRGKTSSGPGLPSISAGKEAGRDSFTVKSLPMTSMMNPRFITRDPTKVLGIGPHAHYMAALARLCDAVQVIDQIARQVEDPGLKFSSSAYVGLELSTKNAAEFFGFYVCRFAINDIGMMLDKFVKRGSEWVLG